ncbi:5-oxoprolinase subunit PxpA [Tenacibaculum xiamenense]|uniref:5-oxoprolinase subunit PxpA n=1 Tax=Tenacibaculum xiamenense TaxID=1261553 RepID=UPI003894091E
MIIDINCDVGEGIGNEAQLLPFISSCNIACGGHAGDLQTIDKVIELAKQYKVKIGAHPSFPDKENFGRKVMDISSSELKESLTDQVSILKERVEKYGGKLHHVKAHGALYNLTATDKKMAKLVVDVVLRYCPDSFLYVPYQSEISKEAMQKGLQIKYEAFADRNYNYDLTLVSRSKEQALIYKKEEVFSHVLNMLKNNEVKTITGQKVPIEADTFCIHGDSKNADVLVKYLFEEFKAINIEIAKMIV